MLPDITQIVILVLVGIISGFINVNAGGGSTLTLPVLIFMGLDSSLANGTNRVAILIQNVFAVHSFKEEKFFQFKTSLKLALFTLPGAVAGALIAVRVEDALFQKILGVVMIGIILSMLFPQKFITADKSDAKISPVTFLAMFGIGFYGGFIQVGVGFLIMASLKYLMKLNLIIVNMHKVFIVFIYTLPAIIIFAVTDNINWYLGLTLAAGNAIGGWWGAKLSVKKGEKLIKAVLIISILIMSVKLLGVF